MIHGVNMADLVEAAKLEVQGHFVAKAEADGTPPTLRAMYAVKLREAQAVLAGGSSELISGEAAIRGVTPEALATVIVGMAAPSNELELARMEVNVRLEKATRPGQITAILKELGLKVTLRKATSGTTAGSLPSA